MGKRNLFLSTRLRKCPPTLHAIVPIPFLVQDAVAHRGFGAETQSKQHTKAKQQQKQFGVRTFPLVIFLGNTI